jgi:hypothetical protein
VVAWKQSAVGSQHESKYFSVSKEYFFVSKEYLSQVDVKYRDSNNKVLQCVKVLLFKIETSLVSFYVKYSFNA